MIIDFLLDVVFTVLHFLVGLLPEWGHLNLNTGEVQDTSHLAQGMALAARLWVTADYFLPLTEVVRLLLYYMAGYAMLVLFRFVVRVKPW